jgi:hypothetical protein
MKANGIFRSVTPSAKLAMVNNQIGNPALKYNQGSTSEIWDYQLIGTPGAKSVIQFFSDVNTKTQPLTNLTTNTLQVGEALSMSYLAFTRMVIKAGEITSWTALNAVAGMNVATFSFLLDNSRIIKNNSLTRSNPLFNTQGGTAANALFYPDTNLIIPPQISFTGELAIPANLDKGLADEEVYYGLHIFGTGAILNLKSNV